MSSASIAPPVGKWERGTAWPSAKNLRALVNRRLLDASTLRRACDSRADWHVLPPALTERVAITFGREVSELRALVPQVLEDAEVVLVSFFRTVSVEQQRAVLEIITSMNTTVVPRR